MIIRKLNPAYFNGYLHLSMEVLCFIRPFGSKLFRVVGLPDVGNKQTELFQVLNTICTIRKNGIWYFRMKDKEVLTDIGSILVEMGIDHLFIEPDTAYYN
jgi:hypothetical protein